MGGFGSGNFYRWSKKSTVEDFLCININRLRKIGAIRSSATISGLLQWPNNDSGQVEASLNYESDTANPNDMWIRLFYQVNNGEEKFDYKIRIERTALNYGGFRYWFVCPYTGKRVTKLYKVQAEYKFASRHAFKLSYASQSEAWHERAVRKKWKMLRALGSEYDFPIRPKGMHWKTFEQIALEFERNELVIDSYLRGLLGKAMQLRKR